jgi:vacuolar iron transporter family protein
VLSAEVWPIWPERASVRRWQSGRRPGKDRGSGLPAARVDGGAATTAGAATFARPPPGTATDRRPGDAFATLRLPAMTASIDRPDPRPSGQAAIAESVSWLRAEQDGVALYEALARIDRDADRSATFRTIADMERRHASIWADRLRALGATVPPPGRPRARVRFIILVARLFGTRRVASMVQGLEGVDEAGYLALASMPEAAAIAADEREHAATWERLAIEDLARSSGISAEAAARAEGPASAGAIVAMERWHRGGAGTLRAVVFGASDGLVSNLSLVMGVAGATAEPSFILLSGIAGLLAGAFSMAAGEYISVQSQREVLHRQIALERAELAIMPEAEKEELVAIYRSKGLPEDDARRMAEHIFADMDVALETIVREELGLDPKEIASPWSAAGGSFVAFVMGAVVPVIPYIPLLYAGASTAFVLSFGLSLAALFLVGAAVSLLTGRNLLYAGFRQVAIGAAAAVVTYAVGSLIGVSVGG